MINTRIQAVLTARKHAQRNKPIVGRLLETLPSAGGSSPTRPSTTSRRRSACPVCRPYSSIRSRAAGAGWRGAHPATRRGQWSSPPRPRPRRASLGTLRPHDPGAQTCREGRRQQRRTPRLAASIGGVPGRPDRLAAQLGAEGVFHEAARRPPRHRETPIRVCSPAASRPSAFHRKVARRRSRAATSARPPCRRGEAPKECRCLPRHPTTKLTRRPGTAMTRRTSAPSSSAATRSSARAAASIGLGVGVGRHVDSRADLAVEPHRDLDRLVDQQRRVGLGERLVGQRVGMAQPGPQLLADVRGQRCQQQHQRFHHRTRHAAVGVAHGQVVVQLGDPGDRHVEPHASPCRSRTASMVRCSARSVASSGASSVTRDVAGVLVDDVAPDPLQQPEHADHRLGVPRPALVERSGEHLVQPQRVGAVALRTCRPGVTALRRLLPILPNSRRTG